MATMATTLYNEEGVEFGIKSKLRAMTTALVTNHKVSLVGK